MYEVKKGMHELGKIEEWIKEKVEEVKPEIEKLLEEKKEKWAKEFKELFE